MMAFLRLPVLFLLASSTIPISFAFTLSLSSSNSESHIISGSSVTMEQATNNEDDLTTIHRRYCSPFFPMHEARSRNKQNSALIILNTPFQTATHSQSRCSNNHCLPDVLRVLWESTTYHVCADGGANRLYDATTSGTQNSSSNENNIDKFIPDMITGDLDSIRPDVRAYYEEKGVPIVRVEDQNYHDLDKSLMAVEKWIEKMHSTINANGNRCIYTSKTFIYGGFGGRFDQEMACINTLFSWGLKESFQQTQMSIYNEETGVILLPKAPVMNEICIRYPDVVDKDDTSHIQQDNVSLDVNQSALGEGPTCGLIPIGGRCERVYTSGLKWNLNGDIPLEFGGLVSSSNRIVDKVVTVKSSGPLLFSFEIVNR